MPTGKNSDGPIEDITDVFRAIRAFDSLEVGPVKVEKKRLVAPYTVTIGKKKESTDLIYRFEEEVFDPEDPASVNLASMMAAQVALNYGLFCERLVFR
ncbi:MAG TPA: hypothetical protein VLA34_00200, partial [Candidatus Krumholzibacterium sp.]|nr:hypothetical protein [Candidatus Krumholzibacterium sp.]